MKCYGVLLLLLLLFHSTFFEFSHKSYLEILHWILSSNKFTQVSKILLIIQSIKAVVWLVTILPLISISTSFFRVFWDHSKCSNYNWYHCHLDVPQFFELSSKVQVFVYLFVLFLFSHCCPTQRQNLKNDKFVFFHVNQHKFFWPGLRLVFWPRFGQRFVSQNHRIFHMTHSLGQILVCSRVKLSFLKILPSRLHFPQNGV